MFRRDRCLTVEEHPLDVLIASTRLTRGECDVLLRRYKQGKTLEQTALELNLPIRQVERLEKRALEAIREKKDSDPVEPEEVMPSSNTFRIPVFQQKSEAETKREKLLQERLDRLKSGDNVSQWFHVHLVAVGIRAIIAVCAESLSDVHIVCLAAIYSEGYSYDQIRQLLRLQSRDEAKDLVSQAVKRVWDCYPELALKGMINVS